MTTTTPHRNHLTHTHQPGQAASSRRVRFRIADYAVITTTAIVLTALSLVFGTPAAAKGHHGTHGPAHHPATSAISKHDESVDDSTHRWPRDGVDNAGKVATDPAVNEPATAADSGTVSLEASELWLPGHDKCKRRRGLRSLPLWCTDPGAGWMDSTTYRAQNDPGNPVGICDANSLHPASGCRRAPLP